MATYELPPLPYDYDALEPSIDSRIMELHHDAHHQGYVDGANTALGNLEEMRESGDFSDAKAVERNLSFNLSGHINHSIFWGNMSPDGGGEPGGELADKIEEDFGSFENLQQQFTGAASSVEGSGWGMLVYENVADQLMTIQAENHNNRAVQGSRPLLVCDVWEHAFYLQYENNKGEYIDNWWDVVDWDNVAEQYDRAQQGHGV